MPANSSTAAKKRSLNGTRRRTKQRLQREARMAAASSAADSGGGGGGRRGKLAVAPHEASVGLAKRVKLYAHMRDVGRTTTFFVGSNKEVGGNCSSTSSAASKTSETGAAAGLLSGRGGAPPPEIRHRCYLYKDADLRMSELLHKVNKVREEASHGRKRAKIVIFIRTKKAAEKIAPRLGWNGTSAEAWITAKTAKHGFGSVRRVKCLKGVGVLSPDDGPDTAKDILSQFRSGAVHTMVVSTVVAVPLGDASLRSAVTALTSLPAKGASVTILDASVPPSGRDPLPNQSQKPLSICSPAVRGESQASPKLDRSGPIIEALLAQAGSISAIFSLSVPQLESKYVQISRLLQGAKQPYLCHMLVRTHGIEQALAKLSPKFITTTGSAAVPDSTAKIMLPQSTDGHNDGACSVAMLLQKQLESVYRVHAPEKLSGVSALVDQFRHRSEKQRSELVKRVCQKYNAPFPTQADNSTMQVRPKAADAPGHGDESEQRQGMQAQHGTGAPGAHLETPEHAHGLGVLVKFCKHITVVDATQK